MDDSGGESDGGRWGGLAAPPPIAITGNHPDSLPQPACSSVITAGPIECAHRYDPADGLFIIASFFNPADFKTKLRNYQFFSAALSAGQLNWLVVECAFGDADFVLPASPHVVHVRTTGVMWQKERLLNIALSHVPERFSKIAWLDCDLLFERQDWAVRTSESLDRYPVVQCFSHYVRLPRGHHAFLGEGEYGESFAFRRNGLPAAVIHGKYENHGHTGFAWAARREILQQHGFYDGCVAGGGDHLVAHAFSGERDSECIDGLFGGTSSPHRSQALDWCSRIYGAVQGRIGCVPGTVLHLWHGDRVHRRYLQRQFLLAGTRFDPATHLILNPDGCWEWRSPGCEAQRFLHEYFLTRYEDGTG